MAKPFELVAGHVALDLVNTLDNRFTENGPDELLSSYDDLLRFASQSGLFTGSQAKKLKGLDASQALRQAKELRENLAAIAYAQLDGKSLPASNLATLEHYFKQASLHRHLSTDQRRPVWRWNAAAPVWLLAQAAEDFLLSEASLKLRCCASETCRWLFLDTSKNGTRRWCDMKVCGNRMKARRFYARKAD